MLGLALSLPNCLRAVSVAFHCIFILVSTGASASAVQLSTPAGDAASRSITARELPPSALLNWYAYAGGDPVNRWDPSGLWWLIYRNKTDPGILKAVWIEDGNAPTDLTADILLEADELVEIQKTAVRVDGANVRSIDYLDGLEARRQAVLAVGNHIERRQIRVSTIGELRALRQIEDPTQMQTAMRLVSEANVNAQGSFGFEGTVVSPGRAVRTRAIYGGSFGQEVSGQLTRIGNSEVYAGQGFAANVYVRKDDLKILSIGTHPDVPSSQFFEADLIAFNGNPQAPGEILDAQRINSVIEVKATRRGEIRASQRRFRAQLRDAGINYAIITTGTRQGPSGEILPSRSRRLREYGGALLAAGGIALGSYYTYSVLNEDALDDRLARLMRLHQQIQEAGDDELVAKATRLQIHAEISQLIGAADISASASDIVELLGSYRVVVSE